MNAVARRLLLLVACAISGIVALTPVASAQQPLQVELFENPFVCDAIVRPLGIVSGFSPGESVEFSAPELNGVFSRRVADSSGRIEMRWNCGGPQTWAVTVRGLSSGTSTTFALAGSAAPPPPDAPVGAAFDAKSAMTADQMAIWKDFSPFSTVGVYIDVNSSWDNRADKTQSNLTAPWVSQIYADGWSIIPIYVGFQAPDQCAAARFEGLSTDLATARNQGLASAADAVDSVSRLGIGPGNPIYYDMEAYGPGCAEAVLSFLDAWTEGVHSAGYLSGVYGSRSSTMWDLSRSLGRPGFDAPDAVWVSTGNGQPDNYGLEIPSDGQWTNARIHQYRLNVTRTYGGVTREIDENTVNAPLAGPGQVAAPGPVTSPSPSPSTSDADGDGVTDPEPDNCDAVANPDQSDLDNDGDGDLCDRDIDGDGVDNVSDIAPNDATITTAPAATPEAAPEPTAVPTPELSDVDGDGIADPEPDNCDVIANPDQSDVDNDGDGDVCDIDIDGDGVPNEADQEPRDPLIGALPTPTPSPVEAGPTPAPTPELNAEPATDQAAEPDPTPTLDVAPTPQVVVLPTPLPTPTVAPLPTAVAAAVPNESATPTAQAGTPPDQGGELAAEMVTITLEDQSSLLPGVIVGLSMFSFFCVGMGVRSFRRGRGPTTL